MSSKANRRASRSTRLRIYERLIITANEYRPTITQSETPSTNGFAPTSFIFNTDRFEPIRKSVATRRDFEALKA